MTSSRRVAWPPGYEGLMERMARAVGADMTRAWAEGRISTATIARAMGHCAACAEPDKCRIWLDAHESGADRPPRYCLNARLLVYLADQPPGGPDKG